MQDIKIFAFADEANATFDKQIEALKRNNLDGIEIRNVDGENISDISTEKAQIIKEKLDAAGLAVWSIGSPIGKIDIGEDFAPHLEKFKHTLKIANILNCKNIRIFSFYIPNGENPDKYANTVIERLSQLIDLASFSGINLCHENEKGIFGDTPDRCKLLYKSLPKLKGIFDPANFIQCGVDTDMAWQSLKKYIYYMHIKDALADGSIVPAGKGIGYIKEISKDFISGGGKYFTIEPHLTIFDGLTALEREGETSKIGGFEYSNADVAFDTACNAFKQII